MGRYLPGEGKCLVTQKGGEASLAAVSGRERGGGGEAGRARW